MAKKQALLIGAAGGLGAATVKQLVEHGWFVFAADVQETIFTDYKDKDTIIPLKIDITKPDSVQEAFDFISSRTAGLDAVINMAGILKIGSMAELPVTDLEKALEINLLGVYRVNKQFLPLLLPGKGRILTLSSEVGNQSAAPFNGIYSITKHALEAYSDALRRELNFIGVKVIKIQPGPFKTNMTKNAEQLFVQAQEESIYFKENLAKGISYLPKVYKNAHDPVTVAKVILKALTSSNPRTAYSIKPDLPRKILDWLPTKWADKLIKVMLS